MDMMLAAALVLFALPQDGEDLVSLGLRYLSRHQAPEGSWGLRPADCGCPAEPARTGPAAAAAARVVSLIRILDDDDFRRRDRALEDLVEIGAAAVPQLRESVATGSAEAVWRCRTALRRIGQLGTSADVERTGMALTAFLGAGFGPLSKDVHDGRGFGVVVEMGLQWLIDSQKPDGSFGAEPAAAHAWAALALSEAYGLTGRAVYRGPAQKAIDYLASHPATDARGLFYQGMALKSAELGQLNFPRGAPERGTLALAARRADEPASIFIRAATQILQIFTYHNLRLLDLSGLPGIDPSRMEMETIYAVGMALFQADGPRGPHWKAYDARERERLVPEQDHVHGKCDRGSWPAVGTRERLKTAALATLSREFYYR